MPDLDARSRASSEETIGERLRRTAQRFGERDALVVPHQGYRTTYRELYEQTALAARALIVNGLHQDDRVGIWSPSRFEWFVTQFAAARVGAIVVTIDPACEAGELRGALRESSVSLLVMARGFRTVDNLAMLDEVRGDCPQLRIVVTLENEWCTFLTEGTGVSERELSAREASLDPHDPIHLHYAWGTSELRGGATLSHRDVLDQARLIAQTLRCIEHGRACVQVPFHHHFGMAAGSVGCVAEGACVVVPEESVDLHGLSQPAAATELSTHPTNPRRTS